MDFRLLYGHIFQGQKVGRVDPQPGYIFPDKAQDLVIIQYDDRSFACDDAAHLLVIDLPQGI